MQRVKIRVSIYPLARPLDISGDTEKAKRLCTAALACHVQTTRPCIIVNTLNGDTNSEHMNMSSIEPMRRSFAQCVVDPIWAMCQCSYTLDHKLPIDPRMWMWVVTGGG